MARVGLIELFFLSLFCIMPLLIALAVLVVLAVTRRPAGARACPYCAEPIREQAIVCRHCGRDLGGSTILRSSDLDEHEHEHPADLDVGPGPNDL